MVTREERARLRNLEVLAEQAPTGRHRMLSNRDLVDADRNTLVPLLDTLDEADAQNCRDHAEIADLRASLRQALAGWAHYVMSYGPTPGESEHEVAIEQIENLCAKHGIEVKP